MAWPADVGGGSGEFKKRQGPARSAMSRKDIEAKVATMSQTEVGEFWRDFGGGERSSDDIVRFWVENPRNRDRMCQLLSLETDDEMQTAAVVSAAKSARRSAFAAWMAAAVALASLFLTAVSTCWCGGSG